MKVLYTTAIDPFWSDYLSTFFPQWVVQNLEIDSKKLGIPKEMATEIVVRWINSLIEIWIIKEEPMPAEDFAKLFLNVISTPMDQFITPHSEA